MNEAIEQAKLVVDNPYEWLADVKAASGRRIIGCFPLYVPHEVIAAAGMVPVDLYGGSGEMTAAARYLQSITCYPVRSALELLLTGRLTMLDGAVFASVCTGTTSGGGLWQDLHLLPYFHQLVVPRKASGEDIVQYLAYQISGLQSSLETLGGKPVTSEALAASIKRYNRGRALLTDLAAVAARNPDVLPPQDFASVRAAAAFMPIEDYVDLLSRLQAALEGTDTAQDERVKLALVGSLCDLPQFSILSAIHGAGGAVVEDDSPLGRRMHLPVDENCAPIEALARYYVDTAPCPTKFDATLDANFSYLKSLVDSSGAKGVVFLRPLYCDPAGIDYPMLAKRLNTAGIQTLSLDFDGRESTSGQIETRLQAFVEMLRS